MNVILEKGSILRRCQSPHHQRWQTCHIRSLRTCIQHFTRFPHLRRLLVVNVPFWEVWWAGAQCGSHRAFLLHIQQAQKYVLAFRFVFLRAFQMQSRQIRSDPFMASWYRIHQTVNGTEMADVEKTQKMIPFITCEIFPFVNMSASWFLVSIYLIYIFESRLMRSKNQSSATLWVLETCLIVGLLPLIIILITASLSSKLHYEKNSGLRK